MSLRKRIVKELFRFLLVATLVLPILGTGKASADTTWTQTTQAEFQLGTLTQVEVVSPGDVKLAKADSGYVYAFKGYVTKTFWRYNIAANTWLPMAPALQFIGAGGALAYDGDNYIYALAGNGTSNFMRYDITLNSWASLTPTPPNAVNAGGALVFVGGSYNYLYALRGGGYNTFWQYNITSSTWTPKATTPAAVYGGGALAYGGGDFIYALGGMSNNFWQYSITGNSWTPKAVTLSNVGDGGALASDGGNFVYAIKGDNTVTFWQYNITGNSWLAMADTPATPCVYGGGALVYDKATHFFALRGKEEDDFYKYDATGNSWTSKANAPDNVSYGGALAFKGPSYYSAGNLISSTLDTSYSANFSNISWTATTPTSTSVKFQIATNNNSTDWVFKGYDGSTTSYYTVSGTPIWSGHDGDRYIRYKAFLGTTNTIFTPVLSDVSITFTQVIVLPSATTTTASSVEEITATLNGSVANDGHEACQYQFVYGTTLGGPYPYSTGWSIGTKNTGQSFSADITGLSQGTKYYFKAQVKNSAGIGTGSELEFLTKPEAPTSFTATAVSDTQIDLSWIMGIGAQKTIILRKIGGFSANMTDGTQIYFDTGISFSDIGLTPETAYYYSAWSEVTGCEQWSDACASVTTTTAPPPPTPTPPPTTTTPAVVGGVVFPIDKMQVLAPWLGAFLALLLVVSGALVKLVGLRKRA
jgi:hypothetical protein